MPNSLLLKFVGLLLADIRKLDMQELKHRLFTQTNKLKLLGFVSAIPLSMEIWQTEVFVLYFLLFIPLSLSMMSLSKLNGFKITLIDKISGVYLLWILISFGICLFQILIMGGDKIGPRIISTLAVMIYVVFPYLIGRFIFKTNEEIAPFIYGLFEGMVLSCLVILIGYGLQSFSNPTMSGEEIIGHRTPFVIGFIFILNLSRNQPLWPLIIATFLAVNVIMLSETKSAIGAFLISFLIVLVTSAKVYSRKKLIILILTGMFVFGLDVTISPQLQNRAISFYATVEQLLYKKNAVAVVEKNEQVEKNEHLIDAGIDMRVRVWRNLWQKVTDSPQHLILGFGQLGPSYIGDTQAYVTGYIVSNFSAHSEYLDIIVRSGFVGLALYLILIVTFVILVLKKSEVSFQVRFLYTHIVAALIGVLVYGFFHETTRYPYFGVLFYLFVGIFSSIYANSASNINEIKNVKLNPHVAQMNK